MRIIIVLLLGVGLATTGCTRRAEWAGEGTEDNACFPDHRCDPGLTCNAEGICVVGEPPPPPDDSGVDRRAARDRGRFDLPLWPDFGVPDRPPVSCTVLPPTPVVTSYPKSTTSAKATIKGTAGGTAKSVEISGGAFPVTVSVGVLGGFCAEVPLNPSSVNKLRLVAVDGKGCASAALLIELQQLPPGPANLAFNVVAKTKWTPTMGQIAFLSDQDAATVVRFSFSDYEALTNCDKFEQVWYDLGAVRSLNQVVVKYPKVGGAKTYLTCWDLVISSKIAPGPPAHDHPDWVLIKGAQTGGSADLYVAMSGAQARHVALLMYEDGATGMSETFDLAEVEVWGQADVGQTGCP